MMVSLTVNGKMVEIDGDMPLPDFLVGRGINPRTIAVAKNGEVIERGTYDAVVLRAGDVIEIVRMIGGG
ncbi:MAG TPA: sulfur carrier protein ThiS [Dehalococcoidia bacterium]|nr:sulfur carrier protein ThiS [Dehalococcoidia bacterium]